MAQSSCSVYSPLGFSLFLMEIPHFGTVINEGAMLDCSRERTYQPFSSPMNSSRIDDILDDLDICSRDTIVPSNRSQDEKEPRIIIDLLP